MATAHLESSAGETAAEKRKDQLGMCLRTLKNGFGTNVLMMGDFNFDTESCPELASIIDEEGFEDVHLLLNQGKEE